MLSGVCLVDVENILVLKLGLDDFCCSDISWPWELIGLGGMEQEIRRAAQHSHSALSFERPRSHNPFYIVVFLEMS